MATYSWQLLLIDDPVRAITLVDDVVPASATSVQVNVGQGEVGAVAPKQLVNASSNDVLSRLALGGSSSEALAVWSSGRWGGHVESKFYPAVIAFREGGLAETRDLAFSLTPEERADVLKTLNEVSNEGIGWCVACYYSGLAVFDEAEEPSASHRSQSTRGQARF